jgi:hypothetical protein
VAGGADTLERPAWRVGAHLARPPMVGRQVETLDRLEVVLGSSKPYTKVATVASVPL